LVATQRVMASIEKSGGSVKRLIYTSSYASIGGPGSYSDGHQISEAYWAGAGPYISEEHMMEKHNGSVSQVLQPGR
jgi:nucleoside-diphosphate-sugar epimerase